MFMQNENAEIAKRIRGIRLEKNITQSELDKLAGLPQNATSKIESCKRELSATDLQRISKVLGVSTDTILKNDEKKFQHQSDPKESTSRCLADVGDVPNFRTRRCNSYLECRK